MLSGHNLCANPIAQCWQLPKSHVKFLGHKSLCLRMCDRVSREGLLRSSSCFFSQSGLLNMYFTPLPKVFFSLFQGPTKCSATEKWFIIVRYIIKGGW